MTVKEGSIFITKVLKANCYEVDPTVKAAFDAITERYSELNSTLNSDGFYYDFNTARDIAYAEFVEKVITSCRHLKAVK